MEIETFNTGHDCNCTSGLHCDFSCLNGEQIPKPECTHADVSTVVLEIVANCEKTAIQCDYCGKLLTEPKTDCR